MRGLEDAFPDDLILLYDAPKNLHACYCHEGTHGVACFTTKERALRFRSAMLLDARITGSSRLVMHKATFNEARKVARLKGPPVECLMLLDDLENPVLHWVR